MLYFGKCICLLLTSLLCYASAQVITLSDSDGNGLLSSTELSEQEAAHQLCINLDETPAGNDLVVTVTAIPFGNENDFQLSETTFTFLVGTNELRQCFDVTLPLDNLLEQTEFFQLIAAAPSSSPASLIVFILDADVLEVGLDQSSYSVGEESGSIQTCVVALPGAPTFGDPSVSAIEVNIATTVGTAEGNDFAISGNSVMLGSTTTSTGECVTVIGMSDILVEGTETLNVMIDSPTSRASIGGGRGSAVVSILDDEAATVEFQQATITTDEGDTGMMTAVQVCVVLSLNRGTLARNVEAQVTMNGGTANPGEDFSLESTMVTFTASSVSGSMQCLDVMVIGDSGFESDETATFDLSTTSFAELGTVNSVTLTIMNDDDPTSAVTVTIEREVYSVLEGESVEVCAISVNRSVDFGFALNVHLHTPFFSTYGSIIFDLGENRSCVSLEIPDSSCLEYTGKEYKLELRLLQSDISVSLERPYAWLIIVDNDIAKIGFKKQTYNVREDAVSVNICIELIEGNLKGSPIIVRTYTIDQTAIAGSDYISIQNEIQIIPIGSESGAQTCVNIGIINDNTEEILVENFTVHVAVEHINVVIPREYSYAQIFITDDDVGFAIQFNEDTPAVNGDMVFVSFFSTTSFDSATCELTTQDPIDCSQGAANFGPLPANRRGVYTLTVMATSAGETLTLQRQFRSETTGTCTVHLINEGVVVTDGLVTIMVQVTGPSNENRLSDPQFLCRVDATPAFTPCGGIPIQLPALPGDHLVDIRPLDPDGDCTRIRSLNNIPYSV